MFLDELKILNKKNDKIMIISFVTVFFVILSFIYLFYLFDVDVINKKSVLVENISKESMQNLIQSSKESVQNFIPSSYLTYNNETFKNNLDTSLNIYKFGLKDGFRACAKISNTSIPEWISTGVDSYFPNPSTDRVYYDENINRFSQIRYTVSWDGNELGYVVSDTIYYADSKSSNLLITIDGVYAAQYYKVVNNIGDFAIYDGVGWRVKE